MPVGRHRGLDRFLKGGAGPSARADHRAIIAGIEPRKPG
jgi:hypothetical protein